MQNQNSLFNRLRSLGDTVGDMLQPTQLFSVMQPPPWLVDEVQQRIVLLLNHVLQQEPEAMQRLQRQQGKIIALHWQPFSLQVTATPAGLLNVVEATANTANAVDTAKSQTSADNSPPQNRQNGDTNKHVPNGSAPRTTTADHTTTDRTSDTATADTTHADLRITITEQSPLTLLRAAASGGKPATRIEGDVQLAAEINWLTDHVRWDAEEDLSRFVGDAAAHRIASAGRQVLSQLKAWVAKAMPASSATGSDDGGAR